MEFQIEDSEIVKTPTKRKLVKLPLIGKMTEKYESNVDYYDHYGLMELEKTIFGDIFGNEIVSNDEHTSFVNVADDIVYVLNPNGDTHAGYYACPINDEGLSKLKDMVNHLKSIEKTIDKFKKEYS